jgi:predicted XRE-type DNA-binding protein
MENMLGKEIMIRKIIGLQVKKQLRIKFVTSDKAAKLAGITPSQMSSVINGRSSYTIDTLTRIVVANNLDIRLSKDVFYEV